MSSQNDHWLRKPCSISVILIVTVINLVAFFGAARFGFTYYRLPAEAAAAAANGKDSETSLSSSSFPAPGPEFPPRPSPSSWLSSVGSAYPVCVLLSIGDDTGRVDESALPFPLLYRLFDAAKAEIVEATSNKNSNRMNISSVKVLLGVDYTSVACRMARDSLQRDFKHEFPNLDVQLTCGNSQDVKRKLGEQLVETNSNSSSNSNSNDSLNSSVFCTKLLVGQSSRYISQINVAWVELIKWEKFRVVDLDGPDLSRSTPAIPRESWRPTVVTAFSSNHFPVALLLLRSLGKAGLEASKRGQYNISVVAYALEEFNSTLQGLLDCVVRELNEHYHVPTEVRQFDFSAHPSWMRINQTKAYAGGTGEYAWKVIIIHSVLVERGFVLWSDAGSRYDAGSLKESLDYTRDHGFASMHSWGNVPELVHPGLIKYLRYQVKWRDPKTTNCDASRIGFTLDKYAALARPWYDCSQTRQCIAPDGSSRRNHRQDQAALTLLADLSGTACNGITDRVFHHMDYFPNDFSRADSSACYQDPLQVDEDPPF